MIEYVDLQGYLATGEVWCEGPRDNTVWVLRTDGSGAVVTASKGRTKNVHDHVEIAYDIPVLPSVPLPDDEYLQWAGQVVRSYRYRRNPYLHRYGFSGRCLDPTDDEYDKARAIILLTYALRQARRTTWASRNARAALSTKRLRELAQV